MKKTNQNLNAHVSIKSVSSNGKNYDNVIVCLPTENGDISFQVKLAFFNKKLLYKIKKHLESEAK